MLWLLASESVDGVFDADAERLAFRLRMDKSELTGALKGLINSGFFEVMQSDSTALAGRYQSAVPEAEAEAEAETTLSGNPDLVKPKPKKQNFNIEAAEVLAHLNHVCGSRFQAVQANVGLVASRLREGATVASMKAVIDRQHAEWGKDDKMRKYLRPETLFNATKFAGYAGQAEAKPAEPAQPTMSRDEAEAHAKAQRAIARDAYRAQQEREAA